MNKIILGLLLIPVLLVGICAVSASPDNGSAEIPVAEHTADISLEQTNSDVKDHSAFLKSIGILPDEPENIAPIIPSNHRDSPLHPRTPHDSSPLPPKPPSKF